MCVFVSGWKVAVMIGTLQHAGRNKSSLSNPIYSEHLFIFWFWNFGGESLILIIRAPHDRTTLNNV